MFTFSTLTGSSLSRPIADRWRGDTQREGSLTSPSGIRTPRGQGTERVHPPPSVSALSGGSDDRGLKCTCRPRVRVAAGD